MLPTYRTEMYAIWVACERFKLLPEGVKLKWEDNDAWTQALLLAYSQIRNFEEAEERAQKWLSSQV